MAQGTWSTLYFSMGGTDLSSYMTAVDLNESVDTPELTPFGSTTRTRTAGLKDWSVRVTFNQDFANGLLDDLLEAAHGTSVAIEFRPTSAVVGTDNPKRTGNAILVYEGPVSGASPGTVKKATALFTANGALTRAEA